MEIIKNSKPEYEHHLTKYPFGIMELNDCLKFAKKEEETREDLVKRSNSIRASANAYKKVRNLKWKFTCRAEEDGVYLYRIK